MPQNPDIKDAFSSLPSLTAVLADGRSSMAVVRASGTWHLEQNGSIRLQDKSLSIDDVADLIDAVDQQGPGCCLDGWWVRPLTGGGERSVLLQRRPHANPEGLSKHTLELLQSRQRPGANGLIFGDSPSARSALLVGITRFLPAQLVVYIGPVAPVAPDGVSLLHIPPPRHDRDRRELAMLIDRSSAVLFDGPMRSADLELLLSRKDIHDRWLAADSSFEIPPRLETRLTTRIGVFGSPTQSIRLNHLSVRQDEKWEVLLDEDDLADPTSVSQETTVAGASASARLSAQLTSPIDHREDSIDNLGDAPSQPDEDEDFHVHDLLNDDDEPQEVLRESGEIDVPGFVSRTFKAAREKAAAEEAFEEAPTDVLRGERIDDELPGLVATSNIDEVEIPGIQPEQLRQTFEGAVDVDALREEKRRSRANRADRESNDDNDDSTSSKSARRVQRSTELGAESSRPSPISGEHSGQWRRAPSTSGRVIPVPTTSTSAESRTEARTAEFGVRGKDVDRTDEDEPETDEFEPSIQKKPGSNSNDNVRDVIANLQTRRKASEDSVEESGGDSSS